jgi:gliding motility-associated protein GldC
MSKVSYIKITVQLDDNRVPEKIEWEATESGSPGVKEAKSFLLSLWDKNENSTLGIDLWTKEMLLDDMNIHYHQVFLKMADTYKRATKNGEVAEMVRNFAAEFSKKLELEKKINKDQK